LAIEKRSDIMIALAPKMYYINDIDKGAHYTVKGVKKNQNPLTFDNYYRALNYGEITKGENSN
jgi:hypothetical protein